MNLVLDQMPAPGPLSLKAFGTLRRKPKPGVALPRLSVSLEKSTFDAKNLAAYRAICGFAQDNGTVPIPYPQVHAIHLQMHLLTQRQFPLPLIGLVHLKNRIVQERELREDEVFGVQVALVGDRVSDKGLEFDLQTTLTDAQGQQPWVAVATVLHRGKKSSKKKGPAPAPDTRLGDYKQLDAPEDIGRRYGRIAGDMNPIHLYPLTAKLLGFDRHIAHGMWSMARCASMLQNSLGRAPSELEVQFKLPLFLPARAAMRHGREGDGYTFALLGRDGGKTHLTGRLR
ncbi:MAG TPA: MaoC/PaaZ C-terminal domain-containing protein [Verrucomicrobiae bacterium]|nr:MaoC/PaaZ C-terminal domain-containing protein [Verrucomicrobiae bacterium]